LIISSGEKLLRASLRLGPVVQSRNEHWTVFVQIVLFSAYYYPFDNDNLISSPFSVVNGDTTVVNLSLGALYL
jgi:hypothetical protein